MTLYPGSRVLGKYEIIGVLGKGSFATVYRARDTKLEREVALKILHPPLLADAEFVERFQNDARAAAQLDHPHIVKVWDLGEAEGRLYIAMQLLPGGTLAQRIKDQGRLPFAPAVQVVRQVAAALDCAHEKGFVHRDVKPTNVLFNARGEAVLSDFGLVKAVESSAIGRSSLGGVVGTPGYIAPEVWEGMKGTPATDVYALGCLIYEMLTGQPLFQGDTPPAIMRAHFLPHSYPEHWPAGVPSRVQAVVDKAVAPNPDERYASAGALATALAGRTAKVPDSLAEQYKQLQDALAAEDWEWALQLAQHITARAPGYRDVDQLAKRAAEGQARTLRLPPAATVPRPAERKEGPVAASPPPRAGGGGLQLPSWVWLIVGAAALVLIATGLCSVTRPRSTTTPTAVPHPGATYTALPTYTRLLVLTSTALPTYTPLAPPTYTPLPTHTSLPPATYTPWPTYTPLPPPTYTPWPTYTTRPTATEMPRPTWTSSAVSPEAAVRDYYGLIQQGQYAIAWQMLSAEFNASKGLPTVESYEAEWRKSGPARILGEVKVSRSGQSATVTVELYYPDKNAYHGLRLDMICDPTRGVPRFGYWLVTASKLVY